jgi:protease-4
MAQFFKFLFASCLGTILALFLLFFILIGIISSVASSSLDNSKTTITDQSVLRISIPAQLPEQTNNVAMQQFSIKEDRVLGLHDYALSITKAATDPKIKGIFLNPSQGNHGYASLKVIRDALLEFKKTGKFIYSYSNYYDHNNYFLASTADQISIHPLGMTDLKGFNVSIPFFKEIMEKIGLNFNIYYAGEFKSATEPFRLEKMSAENRLQMKEYLESQYNLYVDQVASSRNLTSIEIKSIFDGFLASSPSKAQQLKIVDTIAYEIDVLNKIRLDLGIDQDKKINFITPQDYFNDDMKNQNYSANNRIAVIFAEGSITDGKGDEGEIGRKYIKLLRELRANKSIKAVVLRVNSGGGSALLSDDFLKEIDLIKSAGKPVVTSMGDYAASGGYYIAAHSDSIFASAHTLTGSIGVFAMIPNLNVMSDKKIGIDYDTLGTGPMASKFNVFLPWGDAEKNILQENVEHTYDQFLSIVADGRKMTKDQVHQIARGRIWNGNKAKEIGLVNAIGELNDAVQCAARLASIDNYRISEYPTQKDPIQKLIDKLENKDDATNSKIKAVLKENLGELYPVYKEWNTIKSSRDVQMKLPYMIQIK